MDRSHGGVKQFWLLRDLVREFLLNLSELVELPLPDRFGPADLFLRADKRREFRFRVRCGRGGVFLLFIQTGIPGLALPCGFTNNNLPVGMQILGPHFSEKTIFSVAKEYQQSTDWHQKKAKIV